MNKTSNIYSTLRCAKFVLKPTTRQKEILESFFGISKTLHNISLYTISRTLSFGTYELENDNKVPKIPSEYDLIKSFTKLKNVN